MLLKGFSLLFLLNISFVFSAKLLRVPKIYNALITSKEKILPSEAYPATTGPIFQPIGLPGEPILIHPGLIISKTKEEPVNIDIGTDVKVPLESSGSMRKSKPPTPIMFYPRYSLYYAHQPYLTLQQQPLIYTPYEVPNPLHALDNQHSIPRELEAEERKDLSFQKSKMKLGTSQAQVQAPSSVEYVKNNRPLDRNIPDIPPPPPPVRFRQYDDAAAR